MERGKQGIPKKAKKVRWEPKPRETGARAISASHPRGTGERTTKMMLSGKKEEEDNRKQRQKVTFDLVFRWGGCSGHRRGRGERKCHILSGQRRGKKAKRGGYACGNRLAVEGVEGA